MKRDELPIPTPCHADWDEMTGESVQRHCAQCDKSVHNLSEMTEPAARTLLATRTEKLCIRYQARNGQVQFQPSRRTVARGLAAGALLAASVPASAAILEPGASGREGLLQRLLRRLLGEEPSEPSEPSTPEVVEVVEMGGVELTDTGDPEYWMGDYDPDWDE